MPMEHGGRILNIAPSASAAGLRCNGGSGYTFIGVGAATFTLTCATGFAGSYATPGNILVRYYTNTASNGTAAWVLASQAASNAITIASGICMFYVDNNSLPDTKNYVKVTASAGTLIAVQGDLTIQRTLANLTALSA